jgi:hypothetical protein
LTEPFNVETETVSFFLGAKTREVMSISMGKEEIDWKNVETISTSRFHPTTVSPLLRNHGFVIEKYVETTVSQYIFGMFLEG